MLSSLPFGNSPFATSNFDINCDILLERSTYQTIKLHLEKVSKKSLI